MDAVSLLAYLSLRWSCCCSSSWHCSCSSAIAPTIDSSFKMISLSFVTCLFGAHTTTRVTSYRFPHGKCSCKSFFSTHPLSSATFGRTTTTTQKR
jgi:hypothetical protein